MLLQQKKEHVSIVYTCNTYFVMHWSKKFIWEYLVNVLIQYTKLKLLWLRCKLIGSWTNNLDYQPLN